MATSPIYLGISWAIIPIVTGKNSLGFPKLNAIPIARPSIKLCKSELSRFKNPVDSF